MGSGRSGSPCPGWHCNGQKARSSTGDHWQYNGHCNATEVCPGGCRHRVHRNSRRRPRRQVVEVAGQLLAARSMLESDSAAPAPGRGVEADLQLRPGTERKTFSPAWVTEHSSSTHSDAMLRARSAAEWISMTRSPSNSNKSDCNFKLLCGKLELEPLAVWSKNGWSPPAVQRELEERPSGLTGLIIRTSARRRSLCS